MTAYPKEAAMGEILLTPAGVRKLTKELDELRGHREAVLNRIGRALNEGGVAAENGDYLDAALERELLDSRIARLEHRLRAGELVEPVADGKIDIGERVTLLDRTTGATTDYRIVGSGEGDPAAGEISHNSPVGSAVLGRRVGDAVEVAVPRGTVWIEVVDVDG
jgi:transcription elongation factor GreA